MSLNVKIIMFMLMCMTGCQKHIVETNVREAYIEKLETNQIYKITCKEEINKIIYNVNSSKREFCIFIPDVKVVLIYRDNKKRIILINGNKFKIDGITYVSSDKIWEKQFN